MFLKAWDNPWNIHSFSPYFHFENSSSSFFVFPFSLFTISLSSYPQFHLCKPNPASDVLLCFWCFLPLYLPGQHRAVWSLPMVTNHWVDSLRYPLRLYKKGHYGYALVWEHSESNLFSVLISQAFVTVSHTFGGAQMQHGQIRSHSRQESWKATSNAG